MSAVSRPKPSSGPLALKPVKSRAVTRPPWHDTPDQALVLLPEQTSPFQVAAPFHAGCAGQERAQTASVLQNSWFKAVMRPPWQLRGQLTVVLLLKQTMPCQVSDPLSCRPCRAEPCFQRQAQLLPQSLLRVGSGTTCTAYVDLRSAGRAQHKCSGPRHVSKMHFSQGCDLR